jgi:hypothetical protein
MISVMKKDLISFGNASLNLRRGYLFLRGVICMHPFGVWLICRVKVVDAKGVREVTDFDKPETVDLMQE